MDIRNNRMPQQQQYKYNERIDNAIYANNPNMNVGYNTGYQNQANNMRNIDSAYAGYDEGEIKKQMTIMHKCKNIARNIIREPIIIVAMVIIAILVLFIRPFYVPSGSMVPTLIEGDRILSIASYFPNGQTFQEGDIVCFTAPDGTVYVKRVIANGGDLVEISGDSVYVNGELSPWQGTGGQMTNMRVQLTDDEYFVMGDNRGNSEDSRFIGPIKADKMISKVVAVYFPMDNARIL